MNEEYVANKQTFLQVDVIMEMYAPQAISVFYLLNAALVWGDP